MDARCRTWTAWASLVPLTVVSLCSCRQTTPSTQPARGSLPVTVSIPPQRYFVGRVGGKHVDVSVLLAPGQSPATYEPTPKEMVKLARSGVYFRIGVPFERQVVEKIGSALEDLRIVDTRKGIELRASDPHDHRAGGGHAHHHHHEQDPHVWMNPRLVKVQADIVCRTLCQIDPAHRTEYEGNCRAFKADLDRTDAKIAASLGSLRGGTFYVFHPSLGYFADAYGLEQVAIESGGKQPTAKQLAALIDRAKRDGVRLIFVQPQFDKRNAETVAAEIGGAVVPLDPLAEDYIENLLHVAAEIRRALATAPDGS